MTLLADFKLILTRKKRALILFSLLALSFQAFAQPKLGVKVSPSIVLNRIKIESGSAEVSVNGAGFRPSLGIIADFSVTDVYSFSTGLTYISKTAKLKVAPNTPGETPYTNNYSLQYLQVPLTLKLFTNEIAIDKKLYFQAGFNAEIMVYNENKNDNPEAIRTFNFFDIPLVLGAGMEMNMGTSTILFTGISYQRGLINASLREHFGNEQFILKNDLIGIDVGLKF